MLCDKLISVGPGQWPTIGNCNLQSFSSVRDYLTIITKTRILIYQCLIIIPNYQNSNKITRVFQSTDLIFDFCCYNILAICSVFSIPSTWKERSLLVFFSFFFFSSVCVCVCVVFFFFFFFVFFLQNRKWCE